MRQSVSLRRRCAVLLALLIAASTLASAQVRRLVVLKVDGLPPRLLHDRDRLPWITRVFVDGGASLDNFYVRGLSLSAPSWSLLDTGRPLEIHGNVEYDRYTLRPYDYLNFVPFYFSASTGGRVDMRGVELLDELHVPLLLDRFPPGERHQSFQLLQRGVNWDTLTSALKRFVSKAPRQLLDDWIVGMSMSDSVTQQSEADLLAALKNPKLAYLDYFTGEYDHIAHLTNDPVSQMHQVEELDALVGRVWTAIQASPLAEATALVLISDHGMNTEPGVISQGYNLVDWFGSAAGGGHHVLTNRHPLSEFKMRGLDPFVSAVITPSEKSPYLKKQAAEYPTAMLDLDGNERASIGLRSNTLNILHVLLSELQGKRLTPAQRKAAARAVLDTVAEVHEEWSRDLQQMDQELARLDVQIKELQARVQAFPKKWTPEQLERQEHRDAHRVERQLNLFLEDQRDYAAYAKTIRRLFALEPPDLEAGRVKPETVIPTRSLGPLNSVWDLQHYATGPAPTGLVLTADGRLDMEQSFARLNYLAALRGLRVRNNVQTALSPEPVDFIALSTSQGIWLYHDEEHQALIQWREGNEIRYLPIAHLRAERNGTITYEARQPDAGFPLAYAEDPAFPHSPAWLSEWHTEREWFEAVHGTRYSNAIIGLIEQLRETQNPDALMQRERHLRRTDLLLLANDHWNFNVRGFNPGGNHGSFFRVSTHSVLMFAGGGKTGIPRATHIEQPYDSLSFVPTVLQLMARPEPDLPGPVIRELFLPR